MTQLEIVRVDDDTEVSKGNGADHLPTLCAIGVLAAMAAALAHEAVGHAGACLLQGGEVALLSVIWFRCVGGGTLADLGGPLGGLAGGLAGLALGAWCPPSAVRARLFGLVLAAFALFWFSAQLVSDAFTAGDDWGAFAAATRLPDSWRIVGATAGMLAYATTIGLVRLLCKAIGGGAPGRGRYLIPYVAGALALIGCAAIRPHDGSALETARAVALAPLGYVWAASRRTPDQAGGAGVTRSLGWMATAMIGLAAYAALFGPGVGRLAHDSPRPVDELRTAASSTMS